MDSHFQLSISAAALWQMEGKSHFLFKLWREEERSEAQGERFRPDVELSESKSRGGLGSLWRSCWGGGRVFTQRFTEELISALHLQVLHGDHKEK